MSAPLLWAGMYLLCGIGGYVALRSIVDAAQQLRTHWLEQHRYGRWLHADGRPLSRDWPLPTQRGWKAAEREYQQDQLSMAAAAGHAETIAELLQVRP